MRKTTGWLFVVLAILMAIARIMQMPQGGDQADAYSKLIPELVLVGAFGVWGLYLAGVVKTKK